MQYILNLTFLILQLNHLLLQIILRLYIREAVQHNWKLHHQNFHRTMNLEVFEHHLSDKLCNSKQAPEQHLKYLLYPIFLMFLYSFLLVQQFLTMTNTHSYNQPIKPYTMVTNIVDFSLIGQEYKEKSTITQHRLTQNSIISY